MGFAQALELDNIRPARKGKLDQAKTELAGITEDMDELSRDLLAMQAVAGELTVAQLQ